ncbi:MAG: TetR/AcrR family transcriptional regulator [Pseudomonadota bacterium]
MNIKLPTKDAIIMAAFELYIANPKASLGDIAEHAGVGRATLHRYFPSRQELAVALAKVALRDLDEAVDKATEHAESYTDAVKLMLEAVIPLADRQWFLLHEDLHGNEELDAEYQRQARETRELIEQVKQEGGFDADLPSAWIAAMIDGVVMSAWEFVGKGEATNKQACELAWKSLMQGVGGKYDH